MSMDDIVKNVESHWSSFTAQWHQHGNASDDDGAGLPDGFAALRADEKRAVLEAALRIPYETLPLHTAGDAYRLVEKAYLWQTFTAESDELPDIPGVGETPRREKIVHCFGVAATFTFTPAADSPYSGLLAETQDVIGRLANAANTRDPTWSFNQSVAMKFLVDGQPSLALLGLAKPEGQGKDTNFFRRSTASYTGCPESLGLKIAYAAFMRALDDPTFNRGCPQSAIQLPLRGLAAIQRDGTEVSRDDVRAPWGVRLQVRDGLAERFDARATAYPDEDWRDTLAQTPVGEVLFDVIADTPPKRAPQQMPEADTPRPLGVLTLKTPLVASAFCDRRLFFQHPRRTEDVGVFPRC